MSISHIVEKGKILRPYMPGLWIAVVSVLGTTFVVGGMTFFKVRALRVPISIEPAPALLQAEACPDVHKAASQSIPEGTGSARPKLKLFVASKRGKSYYSLGCKAGTSISTENQVWFETPSEAQSAGYTPSKSCKDLKPSTIRAP
jgi:hypothetical protein